MSKVVLITGATGELGKVVSHDFARRGASLVLPYRSEESRAALEAELGDAVESALFQNADLTSPADVERLFSEAGERFEGIDCVICLAGGFSGGTRVEESPLRMWESMHKLNFMTALLVCREGVRNMRKGSFGRIVTIGSKGALESSPNTAPYNISKAAVISLTMTIAEEVRGTNITSNTIVPSTILTEANKQAMPKADFSRWVRPEVISSLIQFLCSDEASGVNGAVLPLYGNGK